MKTLNELTKEERALLLYFETCAVDSSGRVNSNKMNDDDMKIAKQWNRDGFIGFGRIAIGDPFMSLGSNWCQLGDAAWALAHQERRERHLRLWSARNWQTTEEKRATP